MKTRAAQNDGLMSSLLVPSFLLWKHLLPWIGWQVIELIGEENTTITPKQLEEVMDVLRKEAILEDQPSGSGDKSGAPSDKKTI